MLRHVLLLAALAVALAAPAAAQTTAPVPTAPTVTQPPAGATTAPAPPTATVPQPSGTPQPAVPASDGAVVNAAAGEREQGSDGVPAPLLVLAVLTGLLVLALLAWALVRFFAWDPAWLGGARHAVAEAGWRTSGAWEDFTDWLRRGRTAQSE